MTEQAEHTAFGRFTSDADIEIDMAAHEYKIDPDFLKAIIAAESSGDWENNDRVARVSLGRILPYIGLFEKDAGQYGVNFDGLIGDRFAQIRALASILSRMQQDELIELTARRWFAGLGYPSSFSREYRSGFEYVKNIMHWTHRLREERT